VVRASTPFGTSRFRSGPTSDFTALGFEVNSLGRQIRSWPLFPRQYLTKLHVSTKEAAIFSQMDELAGAVVRQDAIDTTIGLTNRTGQALHVRPIRDI
jgi:hypothetical protein